jgi:hypothetical protein
VFLFVAQALEAEVLQGQIASRVITSTKRLLQVTGRDIAQLVSGMSPEAQQTVVAFFS